MFIDFLWPCDTHIYMYIHVYVYCFSFSLWNYFNLQSMVSIWFSKSRRLTHWRWVTHIRVSKLTIIGSDNGLSPGRRQAIIQTNAGILLIGALGANVFEILIEIRVFFFTKIHLKVSSGNGSYLVSDLMLKLLGMVARALWRSGARRVVPWSETLHEPQASART